MADAAVVASDAAAARPLGPTKGTLEDADDVLKYMESLRMFYAMKAELFHFCVAVTLQFVAVGNAPLMKRTKFTVSGHDQLSVVYKFLRKQLRLKDSESLVMQQEY
ncbi:Ubiquitin-related domain [Phytophthora cactorum]|nr:Ubiquitin-related domain [Phytophthora cactorum]